jgi:hypothetical protein
VQENSSYDYQSAPPGKGKENNYTYSKWIESEITILTQLVSNRSNSWIPTESNWTESEDVNRNIMIQALACTQEILDSFVFLEKKGAYWQALLSPECTSTMTPHISPEP